MSKILDNSVWPNGLKEDSEGYAVYYPLGNNKKDISSITWPEGYKLVSPFVYDSNGKVVGFCDTKSLTVSGNTTTTMPYYHIEANFAAISEGKLTVNAPNAAVKKFSWSVTIDSGNTGDTREIKTPYDIWANAEVENEDGTITIMDLNLPYVINVFNNEFSDGSLKGNKVYDENGEFVANVQTEKIVSIDDYWYFNEIEGNFESLVYTKNAFRGDSNNGGKKPITTLPKLTATNILGFVDTPPFETKTKWGWVDSFSAFDSRGEMTDFDIDMPSLLYADVLFSGCGVTSFTSKTPKLIFANEWWGEGNASPLEHFDGDFSSLLFANGLFNTCLLTPLSFKNLINTLNPNLSSEEQHVKTLDDEYERLVNGGMSDEDAQNEVYGKFGWQHWSKNNTTVFQEKYSTHQNRYYFDIGGYRARRDLMNDNFFGQITIGLAIPSSATQQDKDNFAVEAGFASWNDAVSKLTEKGWTAGFQFNGGSTYSLRDGNNNVNPMFIKMVEIDEMEKTSSSYTNEDETKYYRLRYFHETTGSTDGYTQFNSLEEAIEHFNIKPIERTR